MCQKSKAKLDESGLPAKCAELFNKAKGKLLGTPSVAQVTNDGKEEAKEEDGKDGAEKGSATVNLEKEAEVKKEQTEEEKQVERLDRWESLHSFAKLVGSVFFFLDVFVKFSYYFNSRFVDLVVKDIYWGLLWIRPFLILGVVIYNFLVGVKVLMGSWKEKNKVKFQVDINYQRK
mmetsp:Transcript_14514/g.24774  ORF Transcript_14514/g.24774 Transcript_14514/m.24774 type:complete len:175 (-) Transcript_14514:1903-2427(-)